MLICVAFYFTKIILKAMLFWHFRYFVRYVLKDRVFKFRMGYFAFRLMAEFRFVYVLAGLIIFAGATLDVPRKDKELGVFLVFKKSNKNFDNFRMVWQKIEEA